MCGLFGTRVWGSWEQHGISTLGKGLLSLQDDQRLQEAPGKGWTWHLWCLVGSKVTGGGKGWDQLSPHPSWLGGCKPTVLVSFWGWGSEFGGFGDEVGWLSLCCVTSGFVPLSSIWTC